MAKVTREVAEKEVKAWLDFKRISDKKRENQKNDIENLIDFVEEGVLSIDSKTFQITHKLMDPIVGENSTISELKYVARLKVFELQNQLKGVKGDDADGRLLSYASALTQQPKGIIKNLDLSDYTVSQSIIIFFMI